MPEPGTAGSAGTLADPIADFDFDAPAPTPGPAATAEGEVIPKTEAAPAADPSAKPDPLAALADSLEKGIPDDIRKAFLATPRGTRTLEADRIFQELSKPIDQGGLGRRPTIEELRDGDVSRVNWLTMTHEFETNPTSWISNFFGPNPQTGQLNPAAETVLESLPDTLLKADPSARLYAKLASAALNPFIAHYHEIAKQMPVITREDSDKKNRLIDALQIVENLANGENRIVQPNGSLAQTDPSKPDPLAAERSKLKTEREALDQQRSQQAQGQMQVVENGIYNDIALSVSSDIDKLLTTQGIKSQYPDLIYQQVVQKFLNDVFSHVSGATDGSTSPMNPRGFTTHRIQLERAVRNGADRNPAVQSYQAMARQAIRQIAPNFLKDVIGKPLSQNGQAHAAAQTSALRTEPQGSGPAQIPPAQNGNGQPPSRPRGVDPVDWAKSQLEQALVGASAIRH